ncbi:MULTISPECIES: DUF6264 family protein [unclassified Curtobacterium]|uniref:DUF6264 family protein n=1 Tax=unclassified Curtobacterium TaxID=257496 RepID=UPI00232F7458|nr:MULTISPECIES: DUF6264 family protein [unclassified Curtobacterium]MDB6427330.1 DUF6264 family protein [Curtobacterium sp. 20TX0008]MDT0209043.1 DUF6264 family protein [Curtobacterium sp. BRD11]
MAAPAASQDPDVSSGSVGVAGSDGAAAGVGSDGAVASAAGVGSDGAVASAAAVGREARLAAGTHRRVADVVATVLLLVLLAVESVAVGGGIVFLSMAFHSCAAPGNTCDAGLGGGVVTVGPVLVVLVLVGTVVGCVLRLVRRRLAWPLVLVGIAAQVVVFFAALLLVDSAVQHGF